jgi:multicomponent Na+:H+ antiporter subunit B
MSDDIILRIVGKFLIPLVVVFALYVQFHGEYGPGGGFQAGVILGAALILYRLLFGDAAARQAVSPRWLRLQAAVGVLLYGGTGVAGILLQGQFLEYNVLLTDPINGQHLGIILIELGVLLTVSATITALAYTFSADTEEHLSDPQVDPSSQSDQLRS